MIIEHQDLLYDPAKERAWHLSLWMAPDLNGWCVHDRHTGAVLALYADKGDRIPSESNLPRKPVSVSFTALPEISTLVPESALTPGNEMQHLKMVHGSLPTGLLRDEPISALGARCVYLHDELAELRLLSKFPNARPLPLQVLLIQLALSRSTNKAVVILHRAEKRLDLAIASKGRLLLSNTFHTVTAEDILYYTLFAMEQCGLKPDAVDVLLCGTHLTLAEEELQKRYFVTIAPAVAGKDTLFNGAMVDNAHHWTALMHQFPCAS